MKKGIKFEELFEVVIEPEYSCSVLLELQRKYNLDTYKFLEYYKEGIPLPFNKEDIELWLFRFEVFMIAEGNLNDLIDMFYQEKINESMVSCEVMEDKPIYKNREEADFASSFYAFESLCVIVK